MTLSCALARPAARRRFLLAALARPASRLTLSRPTGMVLKRFAVPPLPRTMPGMIVLSRISRLLIAAGARLPTSMTRHGPVPSEYVC
ncbi:MAG TPA: hypothetical protein VGP80_01750 [Gemmatimonadales bacterium]|nr:hypothetical protein [Gemmatimonadales bacterium]